MLYRFMKKIDCNNKILIPKITLEKMGRSFYMEIYEDKIILIPIKK